MQEDQIKDQLLGNLNSILTFVQSTGTQALDFAKQQTPLLIQEIIKYNLALHTFLLIMFSVFFAIAVYVTRYGFKYQDTREGGVPCLMIGACASIFTFVGVAVNTVTLLKIYYAPRLFMIQYIMELIHGK